MKLWFIRRQTEQAAKTVGQSVGLMLTKMLGAGQAISAQAGRSAQSSIGLFAAPAMTPHFAPSLTPAKTEDELHAKGSRLVPQPLPTVVPIDSARHFGTRLNHQDRLDSADAAKPNPLTTVSMFTNAPQFNAKPDAVAEAMKAAMQSAQPNPAQAPGKPFNTDNIIPLKDFMKNNSPDGPVWTPPTLNI